jgi:hypothetical protein
MAQEGGRRVSAQFWPCPGCSRHIKKGDAICPFCGAKARPESGPTRVLAGRLSRAAIFAGAMSNAAAAATACSSSSYGGAPCPCIPEIEDSSAADAPSEAADAADASTTPPADSSSYADARLGFGILYGAAIIPDE